MSVRLIKRRAPPRSRDAESLSLISPLISDRAGQASTALCSMGVMTEPLTYPLTAEQRRERRRDRLVAPLRSQLRRLTWERQEIQDEYRKAAEVYARKLEKLKVKAERNAAAMRQLADETQGCYTDQGRL